MYLVQEFINVKCSNVRKINQVIVGDILGKKRAYLSIIKKKL